MAPYAPMLRYGLRLSPDGGGAGGGTGAGTGGGTGNPPSDPPAGNPPRAQTPADEFIAAKGGARRAVKLLLADNHALREKNRGLSARTAVPDGAVVLTGDDAKHYAELLKRGALADLPKRLDQAAADATFRAERAAADHVAAVAAVGKASPKVLGTLLRDAAAAGKPVALETRDVTRTVNGKEVTEPAAYVVEGTGAGAKATPLADYAAREWADYKAALFPAAAPAGAPANAGTAGAANAAAAPVRYPAQVPTGAAPDAGDVVARHLANTDVSPGARRAAFAAQAAALAGRA